MYHTAAHRIPAPRQRFTRLIVSCNVPQMVLEFAYVYRDGMFVPHPGMVRWK